MRLEILAVGRLKSGPERELFERYSDRISKSGRATHLTGPHLFEITESRADNASTRKQDEARQLLSVGDAKASLVLLDERGKDFSSRQLADLIRAEQEKGLPALAFAIGGPDGHGDELKKRSSRTIRFGAMTWPHQLARVMLAEQLYRSITILCGHPYHRE